MADLLLSLFQHGHDLAVLLLLQLGLGDGGVVLLGVRHRHHGQDQVDEVEGAQEDHKHEEDHVGLPRRSEGLETHHR